MTYYIDPQQGSNRHDGLCPDTPLKDLSPLAGSPLPPGTEILLRAGSRLTGSFTLTAAGEEKQPVRIASYGGQARPVMDGAGGPYALCLHNSRYVEVEDLELRNAGGAPAFRCGLLVSSGGKTHGGGALRHTVLRRLTIHAVPPGWGGRRPGCISPTGSRPAPAGTRIFWSRTATYTTPAPVASSSIRCTASVRRSPVGIFSRFPLRRPPGW